MFVNKTIRPTTLIALLSLAVFAGACTAPERAGSNSETSLFNSNRDAAAQNISREPTLTLAPVEQGEGGWKVATNEAVTFTVSAPGANEVKLLYRPVISDESFVELKTLTQPMDSESGKFQTEIKTPEDFAGEVWARVSYPNGTKQTEPITLTTQTAIGSTPLQSQTTAGSNRNQTADNSPGSDSIGADESARSDKATGGRVVRAALRPGGGDLRITVNVPAFLLTLWQGNKEVATYHVGVGRKAFPIPIGEREANRVILNPAWIPPDSQWVRESESVEPYERIPADDPRNPLGKIKIPLGNAYLIHEAQSPSDIGNLVSHGCIRVRREDLFDLTRKIATARALPEAAQKIERARDSSERIVLDLDKPLPVDINYDTQVVEGATLRLYPDVYERKTNTIENLRDEIKSADVDEAKLEDATLRQMLERVSSEEKFVVRVADVRAGQALARGKTEPLTPQQAKKPDEKDEDARSGDKQNNRSS